MAEANLWFDFLNERPELAYYGQLREQRRNLTPNQQEYFNRGYGPVWDAYQGALGQQLYRGQEPTLRFTEYLQANPFSDQWAQLPSDVRGAGRNAFVPQTRWIV